MLDLKILVLLERQKGKFSAYPHLFAFKTINLLCFLAIVRAAISFIVSSFVMAGDVISEPFIGS